MEYKLDQMIKGLDFREGEFNVLALITDDGGCGWYRVRQYLNKFKALDLANVHLLEAKQSEQLMAMAMEHASVIIARNTNTDLVRHILSKDPSKKIIVDHDDNTFQVDKFNEHYMDFGVEDVWEGETPLYVTGVTPGFDKYRNLWGRQQFEYMLKVATLTTSPVENLSDLWGKFNGKSAVTPNGIDFNLYPNVKVKDNNKPKDEIRIGWHGGISHLADIGSISKPLRDVLQENKKAKYYTTGAHFSNFFKGYESRVVYNPWISFQAHPFRLATLDLDVGIIPLSDHPFNDFKSEIKFTELSALKIPSLVVDRLPYSRVCENEVNCLTYSTPDEFESQLNRLIKDKALRDKLAKNAYDWVRAERDMNELAKGAIELYKTL